MSGECHGRARVDSGAALWLAITCCWIVAFLLLFSQGLTYRLVVPSASVILVGAAVASDRSVIGRRHPTVASLSGVNAQLCGIISAGVMATYAAATAKRPFIDATLLLMDRSIGYRWEEYAGVFASNPVIGSAFLSVYGLIGFLTFFTATMLVLLGRGAEAERYVLAFLISLAITIIVFGFFPARTAWGFLQADDALVHSLRFLPRPDEGWERELIEVREGDMRYIAMGSGIIGFPSFHCVTALLAAWSARGTMFRWPIGIMAAAMVAATPIVGGHYLADLIAGAVVAIIAIQASRLIHRRLAVVTSEPTAPQTIT